MNHKPFVTIVILNYNRAKDTIECIRSINDIDYPNFIILLIDNCSTDNSVEILRKQLKDVEIIKTEKNLGYTGGVNFGLKMAQEKQPDYILLINNDTLVEKTFLTEMTSAMENDRGAAVACGTILCEHNRKEIWYAGGKIVKWRGLAIHNGKKSIFNYENSNRSVYTTFVTGCMMLIRTEYLQEIGLEDERFFMYLDDIEMSARIQRKGFKLLYVPASVIYHKVHDKDKSPFMLYYSVRNRLLLISLMLSGSMKLIANIYFLSVITLKMVIWKFINPRFFQAAKYGLEDYLRKNFFKGRGFEFL
jgi:GT2 family glycosyltransferase